MTLNGAVILSAVRCIFPDENEINMISRRELTASKNLHLLPNDELSRRIVFEVAYLDKADSLAEQKVLLALDEYWIMTYGQLSLVTQLPKNLLDSALETLRFRQLVEW
jgi:hypothetical protein